MYLNVNKTKNLKFKQRSICISLREIIPVIITQNQYFASKIIT